MREISERRDYNIYKVRSRYDQWDADMNMGCTCDAGLRPGHDALG